MIAIRANLVAGERHEKYPAGSSMAAMIFVGADGDDAAEEIATRELAARGWATMEIERFRDITNYSQFYGEDTPVNGAFQDARESGFGLVVYPELAPNNSFKPKPLRGSA
ncbi:hypothetical protein [Luteimonas sp. MC1828]|uniref:hypothetical protein n=1 Tax=Luteimonas sp. MC1828 TaxID=2799787 RepID=UPI0018F246F1|nr:hypothetical protein [Luteimonas sp. MC1828]MBJ7575492.1 hypothetical protein [Luteimonas sp. MC1828]